MPKWKKCTGDGASNLALKPMGGVNRGPKQRIPVPHKMLTYLGKKWKNGIPSKFHHGI